MKLSVKSQYGLQAILELAMNYMGGTIQISAIAKDQNIPLRFLEQLLLTLKKKGMLASQRGINGGYSLAKHPSDITLQEIIEALEGPIELTNKKMKKSTIIFDTFRGIEEELKKSLSKITLYDLVSKKRKSDSSYNYSI